MWLSSPLDLGLYVVSRRRELDMTQAQLASVAGVSRRWLGQLEAGKATAEIGKIMRTFAALGLVLDAQVYQRPEGEFDLDEILDELWAGDEKEDS